jgi:hypothetical protein
MVFATSFYQHLLVGPCIGEAVQQAREELYNQRHKFGGAASVWPTYQHYSDPTRTLKFGPQGGPSGR